jgi:CHAT domain-containing protein
MRRLCAFFWTGSLLAAIACQRAGLPRTPARWTTAETNVAERTSTESEDPFDDLAVEPAVALARAHRALDDAPAAGPERTSALTALARAHAAGGNFTRAAEAVRDGLKQVAAADPARPHLAAAFAQYQVLRYLLPTGTTSPLWTRAVDRATGRPADLPPGTRREDAPALERLFVFGFALETAEVSRGAGAAVNAVPLVAIFTGAVASCTAASRDCVAARRRLARLQIAAGRPDLADPLLAEALDRARQSGDAVETARVHLAIGDRHAAPNSEPAVANLALFADATAAGRSGQVVPQEAVISEQAIASARGSYQAAEAALASAPCRRCRLELAGRRAYLDFLAGRGDAALDAFAALVPAFEALGDFAGADRARLSALAAALAINQQARAERLVADLAALAPSRPGATHAGLLLIAGQASRLLSVKRDVAAALGAPALTRRLADALGDRSLVFEQQKQLASVLADVGRHREALALRRELLNAIPPATDPKAKDAMLIPRAVRLELLISMQADLIALDEYTASRALDPEIAATTTELGNREAAVPNLASLLGEGRHEEVVAAARLRHDSFYEAAALIHLNRLDEATRVVRAALVGSVAAVEKDGQRRAGEGSFSRKLSAYQHHLQLEQFISLALILKMFPEAERAWNRAEHAWGQPLLFQSPEEPWERDALRGEIEAGLSHDDLAEADFEQAWRLVAQFAPQVGSSEEQDGLFGKLRPLVRSHVELLFRQGRHADALAVLDHAHARVLNQQLLALANQQSSGRGERDGQLRRWWQAEAEVAALQRRALGDRPDGASATLAQKQAEVDAQRRALAAAFPAADIQPQRPAGPALLSELRAALAAEPATRLVVYATDATSVYAWVVDGAGVIEARQIPVKVGELRDSARTLRNALATPIGMDATAASTLARRLIDPLESLLARPRGDPSQRPVLGFVVAEALRQVPFHLLPAGRAGGHPLIQAADVFYPPSLGAFVRLSQRRPEGPRAGKIVAFGFDGAGLTKSGKEAEATGANPAELFVGLGASLAHYREKAPSASVLHLSSHGVYDRSDPYRSALVLADGPLTVEVVLGTALSGAVVVMSACDSGRFEVSSADNLVGLAPAFLTSGASSVVVAGWQVPEEQTLAMMRIFHQQLQSRHDVARALGEAQRWALARPGARPAVWGAFSVLGAGG